MPRFAERYTHRHMAPDGDALYLIQAFDPQGPDPLDDEYTHYAASALRGAEYFPIYTPPVPAARRPSLPPGGQQLRINGPVGLPAAPPPVVNAGAPPVNAATAFLAANSARNAGKGAAATIAAGIGATQVANGPLTDEKGTARSAKLAGRLELPMTGDGVQHDARFGVAYVDAEKLRRKYHVTMGARLTRRGKAFDTPEIKKHFYLRYDDFNRGIPAGQGPAPKQVGSATLGVTPEGQFIPWEGLMYWPVKALIWVCLVDPATNQPAFYSHVGKFNRFHHSSLSNGNPIIGAGEWIVEKGRLLRISGNSGHYRPTLQSLFRSVLHMSAALQPETTVLMYDSTARGMVERPVRDFITAPSANGRYWVHAQSPPL